MWLLCGAAVSWLPRQDLSTEALFQSPVFSLGGPYIGLFSVSSEMFRLYSDILRLTQFFYGQWINQKAYVFIIRAFVLSKDQDILFPKSRAHRLLLPLMPVWSPQCPGVLSEICIRPFHSLAVTLQGLLAPLRIKLRLHYLSHRPLSLWIHLSSLHSVLRILNTPISPESFLHLDFGVFWSLCWDHVLPLFFLFTVPHSSG